MQIQEVPHSSSAAPITHLASVPLFTRLSGIMQSIWRAMTMNKKVAAGCAIVGFFILVGFFGPFFTPYNPNATSHLFIAPPSAARVGGENAWRIIFFEIFPNEISLVVAGFVSTTIFIILAWAALEFLGLGDGTIPSWGGMLYWAQQAGALGGGLWWWFIPPGFCIAMLGAGLAMINFGIDEVADPRLRPVRPIKKNTRKR